MKWFDRGRGFGFITQDGDGDVFVHYSAIQDDSPKPLSKGQRVEFDVVDEHKGVRAANVRRIG